MSSSICHISTTWDSNQAQFQCTLSALNVINKAVKGDDIFQDFWLSKVLSGYKKMGPESVDVRQPITPSILQKLCKEVDNIYKEKHMAYLLKSMFLLAFHCFLRVGEITVTAPHVKKSKSD